MNMRTAYTISSLGMVVLISLYLFPVSHTANFWLFQLNLLRFVGGIILYGQGLVQAMDIRRQAWLKEHPQPK